MGDGEMKNLLKTLKLECLIDNFERNMVTIDSLQHFTEDIISELIPIIGQRLIFLNYWRKRYNLENSKDLSEPLVNTTSNRKRKLEEQEEVESINSASLLTENKEQLHLQSDVCVAKELKEFPVSLKTLLLNNKIGQRILIYYEKENKLQENFRNKICDIIVTEIENRNAKLTNKLADRISGMIVSVFPTEVATSYYIPPISKKDSITKKSIIARGKLMNMWRNRYTLYKKFQVRLKNEKSEIEEPVPEEIDDKLQESIKWLKENLAPWQLVLQHWHISFDIRRKHFENYEDNTLVNIINEWPILKHPHGYQLIIQDFNKMNFSNVNLNYEIWQQFIEIVIEHSTYNDKDEELNLMLQKLKNENISADAKVALGFMLLSHLIPPKQIKKYDGKYYKSSIATSRSSLIKHASIPGDMTVIREEARKNAQLLKITLQPYVIILGPPDEIKETYVQVDDILYKTTNIVEAIDVCFKTFHVFQVRYPMMSEYIWTLIQKGIYNFMTKWDTIFANIEYVLNKVSQSFRKEQEAQ